MPFCTSCGKEAAPGTKFCEYCGAPIEQPVPAPAMPAPPLPVTPQPTPLAQVPPAPQGTTPKGSGKTIMIAGIVVVLFLVAGIFFVGLPMMKGSPDSTRPQVTTIPAPEQTLMPVTVKTQATSVPKTAGSPGAILTYEEKYSEIYSQVYAIKKAFVGGGKEVFTQDLKKPPLFIKFNITPKIFYEERLVEIGTHNEHIANISYTSSNAWFKVKVFNANTNELVTEEGFNKEHGITTQQEFMVRAPGNYVVEMSGNDVTADIRILIGK